MARKSNAKSKQRSGLVYFDTAKLHVLLEARGESFGSAGGVAASTWRNLAQDRGVFPNTAKRVADYLKRPLNELLRPTNEAVSDGEFQWPEHPEWSVVKGTRTGWEYTSNGLGYFRCKVQHKFVGDANVPEYGRARFYDLTGVSADDRGEMRELLTRHARVCRELSGFPQLARNKSVLPVAGESFWWVIDEWFESTTLAEMIDEGPVGLSQLLPVMQQVLDGLRAMHERKIVLRELSPRRVLIGDDGTVRLTDLDLAKLLLHGTTVSAEWPIDPYRAPEVESGQATPQADYYSWAVVFLHAVTGDITIGGHDDELWEQLDLPRPIVDVLKRCVASMPSKRPRSIQEIRKALD
ncbi:MAG: hypothetical protein DWQ35_16040 [Planctomycetota bacterium]|nr:MAG: hypothetical protein DWQ35_16040 [Planctomycetota bacterium]REK18257.1 MAG: hypothetical protein DWQ42_20475 [Planctomycetota bacterium]REK49127.1 MAG: hypothetical protein DWQ46_01075 [Planctomycetota bacterium]